MSIIFTIGNNSLPCKVWTLSICFSNLTLKCFILLCHVLLSMNHSRETFFIFSIPYCLTLSISNFFSYLLPIQYVPELYKTSVNEFCSFSLLHLSTGVSFSCYSCGSNRIWRQHVLIYNGFRLENFSSTPQRTGV